jgi:hypothetical protein
VGFEALGLVVHPENSFRPRHGNAES